MTIEKKYFQILIPVLFMLGTSVSMLAANMPMDTGSGGKKYFNLKVNAALGGGYDTNLFRERYPLTDDFDYPTFQPDVRRESPLFDMDGNAVLAYTLPELSLWRKSVLSVGGMGSYSRVARESKNSNLSLENYYTWGVLGDWFIQFTGNRDNEGLFFVIRDVYKQTRYNEAEDYIESESPGTPADTYNYNENKFKVGLGYMLEGVLPVGLEYKLTWRNSPERSNPENYDYKPGPVSLKMFTGVIAGSIENEDRSSTSASTQFDPNRSIIAVSGFVFRFVGELWSREYETYRARTINGTVSSKSPLLKEYRESISVDLHFGTTEIAPIFETRQTSGLHLHYQWYNNRDNYDDYYDYSWNRGWIAYYAGFSIITMCVKYEYHWKKFDKRVVVGRNSKREDRFHVAGADVKMRFNDNLMLSLEYTYTYGESNEDLIWIDYDKHHFYAALRYNLDLDF